MAIPLAAPGASTRAGLQSGQDFMKGIEDIKASRQSRKESQQRVESAKTATEAIQIELDEFQKDVQSGLLDQQRFNKLKEASVRAIELDTLGTVAETNKQYAADLAKTGAVANLTKAMNSVTAAQNEQIFLINQRYQNKLIDYNTARELMSEMPGKLGQLPEDEEAGKAALGLGGMIAKNTVQQQQKLDQIEAQMSDAVDTYETETMIDGVAYKQLRSKRDGSLVNQYLAVPKSPLVQVNTQDKAVNASNKEFLKRVRSEETRGRVSAAVAGKQNAKLAITSSQGDTLQGPLAKPIVELAEGAKTLAKVIGADALADKIDFTDEGILKGTTGRALLPFVKDYGGRGFTDADAERMMSGVASITNVQEANQVFGKIALAGNINTMEQAGFEEAVATRIEQGQIKSPGNVMTNYSDYQQDMPRFKATPDGFAVVDDGRNLWKYYVEGRPKVWVTAGGDFTHQQLMDLAKEEGTTFREAVQFLDETGQLDGTR